MQTEQQQRIMGYFIEEAKDHLNTIEQGLLNLQSTLADSEMVNELFRAAHSVKGGAAMLGLNSIQTTSHRLEDAFKVLRERPIQVDQKLESLFLQVSDTLKELIDQLSTTYNNKDEASNPIMTRVEPVFTELHQHLEALLNRAGGSVTPDGSAQAAGTTGLTVEQVFQEEVVGHLREMLQLFKQADTASGREHLQQHCQQLRQLGERFGIAAWCGLADVAKGAIANLECPNRTLAPLVIKELKQGQELVLSGRSHEITASEQLRSYVLPVPAAVEPEYFAETPEAEVASLDFNLDTFNGTFAQEGWGEIPSDDFASQTSDYGSARAVPTGPEVGTAELNTLADLFEGESPELDETWQEEEIINDGAIAGHSHPVDPGDLDFNADFSDLLDAQAPEASTLADPWLGDDWLDNNPSEDLETSPEAPVKSWRDLSSETIPPDEDFADLLFEDEAPLAETAASGEDLASLFGEDFLGDDALDLGEDFTTASGLEPVSETVSEPINGQNGHQSPLNDLNAFEDLDLDSEIPTENFQIPESRLSGMENLVEAEDWESWEIINEENETAPIHPQAIEAIKDETLAQLDDWDILSDSPESNAEDNINLDFDWPQQTSQNSSEDFANDLAIDEPNWDALDINNVESASSEFNPAEITPLDALEQLNLNDTWTGQTAHADLDSSALDLDLDQFSELQEPSNLADIDDPLTQLEQLSQLDLPEDWATGSLGGSDLGHSDFEKSLDLSFPETPVSASSELVDNFFADSNLENVATENNDLDLFAMEEVTVIEDLSFGENSDSNSDLFGDETITQSEELDLFASEEAEEVATLDDFNLEDESLILSSDDSSADLFGDETITQSAELDLFASEESATLDDFNLDEDLNLSSDETVTQSAELDLFASEEITTLDDFNLDDESLSLSSDDSSAGLFENETVTQNAELDLFASEESATLDDFNLDDESLSLSSDDSSADLFENETVTQSAELDLFASEGSATLDDFNLDDESLSLSSDDSSAELFGDETVTQSAELDLFASEEAEEITTLDDFNLDEDLNLSSDETVTQSAELDLFASEESATLDDFNLDDESLSFSSDDSSAELFGDETVTQSTELDLFASEESVTLDDFNLDEDLNLSSDETITQSAELDLFASEESATLDDFNLDDESLSFSSDDSSAELFGDETVTQSEELDLFASEESATLDDFNLEDESLSLSSDDSSADLFGDETITQSEELDLFASEEAEESATLDDFNLDENLNLELEDEPFSLSDAEVVSESHADLFGDEEQTIAPSADLDLNLLGDNPSLEESNTAWFEDTAALDFESLSLEGSDRLAQSADETFVQGDELDLFGNTDLFVGEDPSFTLEDMAEEQAIASPAELPLDFAAENEVFSLDDLDLDLLAEEAAIPEEEVMAVGDEAEELDFLSDEAEDSLDFEDLDSDFSLGEMDLEALTLDSSSLEAEATEFEDLDFVAIDSFLEAPSVPSSQTAEDTEESLDFDLFDEDFELSNLEADSSPSRSASETLADLFDTDLGDSFINPAERMDGVETQELETELELEEEFGDLEDLLTSPPVTLAGEMPALDELDDLLSVPELSISSSADFLDLQGFDELDDLLSMSTSANTPVTEVGAEFEGEFDELESLLETSPTSEFADLDNLLGEPPTFPPMELEEDGLDALDSLLGNTPVAPPAAQTSLSQEDEDEFGDLDDILERTKQILPGPTTNRTAVGQNARPRTSRGFEQNMRVPVKQLDNLSNLVGELVVNRNTLEQDQERLRQFLDNLLHQVQQLSDVGQRMQDRYERSLLESSLLASRQNYRFNSEGTDSSGSRDQLHATGVRWEREEMDLFTPFHTLSQEIIELIVRVRESASDIEFLVDETDQVARMLRQVTSQLQEGLTRSRMVPFAQTADRLPRAVREVSLKCGKQAELIIEGRDTLIDKVILEHLYDPMTHLVNNAITHGIETPDVRVAAGKSPVGRITIRVFHQGNQTVISVADDGAGINPERVKQKALEKGLITPPQARSMTNLDVYDLLFQAGFSTKDKADDFSGRGVGMDVVRTSLTEIRGTITTDSAMGKGTTFTIRLPLTLSICKALCCLSERARIAFPMDGVEDMMDVAQDRIITDAEGNTSIQWRDSMMPFQPLSNLLKYNRYIGRGVVYGGNQEDDLVSIIILRSSGNYLAVQVDQVLGEQEIVIKQLEGPVPKPVGVAGATVLGDGRIMVIGDVLELIDLSMGRIRDRSGGSLWEKSAASVPVEAPAVKTDPMVLIVDDSITVRELLSMTFNKAGYRVEQARDGQEAWEKLRSGLPCEIVFCDIEMPRMDGLELLSRIQKDSTLNHLPVAMLTSRGADRHRQMAAQLGASGYFTKPYLEEMLLDAAQRMIKGEKLLATSAGS